ncbi:O-antigen ligase family protein [Pelagibacterium halotolerans]|uniref:O-antigen ligase-related domain-containing protein n=1 Tax=Pelagibacterium halotolerans (strain DSM 22347 / JCM 15775 / CGMCC 1.7692 / B2) TaxID=1082931 RepID=G4RGZ3_PELHB|nr:O-antigen ligase family protein [Pelagibacterium halotolerans]AEQ53146.1 hypothetical protein KKY_3156 [Pelagibacterium halotolerans B2]QJR17212.1 O-antigen ligase family protein [Pelagibacterium halotolerans]SEA88948.1 O-Antigen ligase [Pelagibacterium halotolerans]
MTYTQKVTAALAGLCLLSGFMSGVSHFDLGWIKLSIVNICAILILAISVLDLFKRPHDGKLVAVAVIACFFIVSSLLAEDIFDVVSYNIIAFSNMMVIVTFFGNAPSASNVLRKIGQVGLLFGAALVFSYFIQVSLLGDRLIQDPLYWNQGGYLFRITHGSIFAFQGLSQNPNVVLMPFIASFVLAYGFSLKGRGAILSLLLILAVALLSSSRGNWAIAGTFLVGVTISRPGVLLVLLSLAGVSGLALVATAPALLAGQIWSIGRKLGSSLDPRVEKWRETFELYLANPWMGTGGGGVRSALGEGAENGYLEWLAQYGFIGITVALSILAIAVCVHAKRLGWRASVPMIFLLVIAGLSNAFNSAFVHPATMLLIGLALTSLPLGQRSLHAGSVSARNMALVART